MPAFSESSSCCSSCAGFVGDLLTLVGHRGLDGRAADHLTEGALRRDLHGDLGGVDAKQILARVANLPEHRAIGLDDVFVARQHLPFAPGRGVAGRCARGIAELNLIDLRDLRQQDGLDRVGPMEMQPRLRGIDPFAESQHHALLVGLNLVDRGRDPADEGQRDDQRDAAPA